LKLLSQLPDNFRRTLGTAAAIIIYLGAAYIVVGRGLLGNLTGRIVSNGAGRDPSVLIWCLAWYPHALANHLNPFLSHAVWAPDGINLAWMPSIPGAAILAWPITDAFGPVASFNALSFLSLPAAAFTAFLLCCHLTGRIRASIVGGYVFGFSPYFLGHLQNHLNLILAFPIPLAALLTVLLLEGKLRPRVFAPLMALLLAMQFLFMLELFATLTAVGIIVLLLGFAIGPEHWRSAVRGAAAPIAAAYGIMAVLLAPYWYYLFAFTIPKSAMVSASGVSTDLFNFLIPTESNLFGVHRTFEAVAARFTFRPEADGWIAWPLLVVIALYVRWRWRKPAGKVLLTTMALLGIATLGPRLRVGGHVLFGLPWKIVEHIPLIKSALPARLTMYIFLILGVMTAVVLASAQLPRIAKYALAIAIVIFMLPNPDYRFWTAPIDLPSFFAQDTVFNFLHRGETVVILPYENRSDSMLWQAGADFYFQMAGGYTGATMPDAFVQWPAVNALYWGIEMPDPTTQLGAFFATHDVGAVIVQERRASEYLPVLAMLKDLCLPPTRIGGVIIYPVAADKIAQYRGLQPLDLERHYDRDRFDRLLVAADKYLAAGAPLNLLKPSNAAMAGLIPPSWAVDNDVYTKDGLILGPWANDRIQVGVVGSYEALRPLIAAFSADAAEVYFPFPRPLSGPPTGNTFMRKLVMVFDRAALRRAASRATSELSGVVGGHDGEVPSIVER
jgi:hypothetical protein